MTPTSLVQAKTGTGKTTAFLLPAIQGAIHNSPRKGQVAVLILSPTRELALQIAAEATRLVARLKRPLEVHTAFGGTAKASNLAKLKQGDPKILVATPGRLNDYLGELDVRGRFEGLKTLVLDEADRMLDAGFLPDILKVLHALPPKQGPDGSQWQGMCFSATIPPKLQEVFHHVLKKDYIAISTLDAAEPPTLAKVPQYSVIIPAVEQTFTALYSLLQEEISATAGDPKIIVFGTTANLVAMYADTFKEQLGLPVFELHSRLSQPARTRATDQFKTAKRGVMFASDVIGRGMDFPDVSLVLQVGLPLDSDAYTHRVGRTARAGKDGRAIILLTQAESFWLRANRQFPIQPFPSSDRVMNETGSANQIISVLQDVNPDTKRKAYSAYLGFMKGFLNKMKMQPVDLVRMANTLALQGMLCAEIPEMEKKTIGKMGLKGVPGLHIAATAPAHREGPKRALVGSTSNDNHPSRRLRHQGVPGAQETNTNTNGFGAQPTGGNRAPQPNPTQFSNRPKVGNRRSPQSRPDYVGHGLYPSATGAAGPGPKKRRHPGDVAKEKRKAENRAAQQMNGSQAQ